MEHSPYRPVDAEAIETTRTILRASTFGALAVLDPETKAPVVSRVAIANFAGCPITLISDLSAHAQSLRADPRASILLGEPEPRGDVLTHPRLSLQVQAVFVDKSDYRDAWLRRHPKAKLYVDFTDFHFARLEPQSALLNAGFGKAFQLTPADWK